MSPEKLKTLSAVTNMASGETALVQSSNLSLTLTSITVLTLL